MDVKVIPTASYLEEYRQKYKPLESATSKTTTSTIVYSTDVQTLLDRYLSDPSAPSSTNQSHEEVKKADENQETSAESPAKFADSDGEDIFDDDPSNTLLPTTMMSDPRRITVDEVMKKDSKLDMRCLRRHSNPSNCDNVSNSRNVKRRASSSPDGRTLFSLDSNSIPQGITRRSSEKSLQSLRRRDSNISNVSFDSSGSNKSYKNDIMELSDEDFDMDFEIDLNSPKQTDTDSQKLFSLFQLDADSQKDSDSLAGCDEVDSGSCSQCQPSSAKSVDSTNIVCTKCSSQNKERYETIKEILESEQSYLKDLLLIQKHFHDVLMENGLLTSSEISTVFGNIPQLTAVSQKFYDRLSQHLQRLQSEGDDNYSNAAIGRLICDSSAMFLAFEAYCLNHSVAVATVDQLRKENQLLNLFLDASQNDNAALRRMDLKTFLMLPVQRIMKYPLLLKRLHKATRPTHSDRESIEKANEKLTDILHHINSQSKVLSSMYISAKDNKVTKRTSFEIALTKLVLNTLNWKHDEIHFLSSGKLGYLQPSDSQWADKLRTLRLSTAFAVLVTRGRQEALPKTAKEGKLLFPKTTTVTEAALLAVKKGNSRLQVIGEPYHLAQCLISRNSEFYDVFEIARDYVKEPFIIRPVSSSERWYRNLKYYSMVLGGRNTRRRNALPNILLDT